VAGIEAEVSATSAFHRLEPLSLQIAFVESCRKIEMNDCPVRERWVPLSVWQWIKKRAQSDSDNFKASSTSLR